MHVFFIPLTLFWASKYHPVTSSKAQKTIKSFFMAGVKKQDATLYYDPAPADTSFALVNSAISLPS